MSCEESYPQPRPASYMNYKLRRERNVFVLLVFVAVPLALLVAPLPFLESVSTKVAAERAAAQGRCARGNADLHPQPCSISRQPRQGALPHHRLRGLGLLPMAAARPAPARGLCAAEGDRHARAGLSRLRDGAALLDRAVRSVARRF